MENASVQRGLFLTFRGFPLIRQGRRPCHLPRRGRRPPAGEEDGDSAYIRTDSAREVAPSSVRAVGPATFPVGEGDLRRGRRTEVLRIYAPVPPGRLHPSSGPGCARSTFPVGEGDLRRGNLKIQLCRQISVDVVADGLFLQDSGFSYLGSFRNPSP